MAYLHRESIYYSVRMSDVLRTLPAYAWIRTSATLTAFSYPMDWTSSPDVFDRSQGAAILFEICLLQVPRELNESSPLVVST